MLGCLIFSEYIEGSSYNKALELYNRGTADVILSKYQLRRLQNGGNWSTTTYKYNLSGVVPAGQVFTLCNNAASTSIVNKSNVSSSSSFFNFNGDDAIGLFLGGALVDAIGEAGADPGTGWDIGGVSAATCDHTLLRNDSLAGCGNTASGWQTGYSWTAMGMDYFDQYGIAPGISCL